MPHWKIHHRLLACFGLVIGLLVVLSAYSVFITQGIDSALSANSAQNAVIQRAAIDFRGSVHDRAIALRDAVQAPSSADLQQENAQLQRLAQAYSQAQQQLQAVLQDPRQQIPPQVQTMLADIAQQEAAGLAAAQQIVQALQAGEREAASAALWSQAKPQYQRWLASINRLIDFEEARISANNSAANLEAKQFGRAMLLITALAVAASLAAAIWIGRSILGELGGEPHAVRTVVQAMQAGDLTVSVPVRAGDRSSVMAAVHEMQQRFHSLVAAVNRNMQQLRTTGADIAQGNLRLGERTEQTSDSLRQATAEMHELSTTVQHSAHAAQQAEALAEQAQQAASRGGAVMQQVVVTMQQVVDSSRQIGDIIGVIDGIAFQTNILALNAAVEAARAGEQGRGFAVVAGEVRSLAKRSAEAARQVKTLIESSMERVNAGGQLVEQAGSSMQDIVHQVQQVNQIIEEMGRATQVQTSGIDRVQQAVDSLEVLTGQNASLVEQGTAAADELQGQAGQLTELVSLFTVDPARAIRA